MNKEISNEILANLKEIIKDPKPELDFNNQFELLVSVLLSAQTTDKRVNIVTKDLFLKYGTPYLLMNANYDDVYNIIKPLGLAKNKTRNIIELSKMLYEDYNSVVPNTIEELVKLPGVGRKTALVTLALGYNIPGIPVDTHLIRMAGRLGYSKSSDPLVIEKAYMRYIKKEDLILSHHLFLLFGRYYCTAKNPKCDGCNLKKYCKYKN